MVSIQIDRRDAFLFVDGSYAGTASWSGVLGPGLHAFSLTAKDCYPVQFALTIAADTKYKITVVMPPLTGLLLLDIQPPGSIALIDGNPAKSNLLEIPVGIHKAVVRKFGYEERSLVFEVLWNRTTTVSITLPEAPFSMTKFRAHPYVFNPTNRGGYGKTSLHFSVTAPGTGAVVIQDQGGEEVLTTILPPFSTWDQRYSWRGIDADGNPLPDGDYSIKLELSALRPKEEAVLGAQTTAGAQETVAPDLSVGTQIKIDRSLEIAPQGFRLGRPGLSYFADPFVGAMTPGSVEAGMGSGFGASLSLGFRVGEHTALAMQGAYDPSGSGSVAAGITRTLFGGLPRADGGYGFSGGLHFRFAWASTENPTLLGTASGMELSFPVAVALAEFRLGLAPAVSIDYMATDISPALRGGIWYASQAFVAGASASFDFDDGFTPSVSRPLLFAFEGRYLLKDAPFTFHARFDFALAPYFTAPQFSAGMGVVW